MKKLFFTCLVAACILNVTGQNPKTYTSSEILLQLKKLNVLSSVLYIAAHPDDENTRLLAYLANEKMYRTGYLSLTRGDGGQNLIGDEQGIDLGLIRTQELLAARRIDGAEQFFSRAFDFGYCKSPEEAMATWGHDKILSDVVWVIRKYKPDVIITRFPTTGEGGHGHHTASAILAGEAFEAAADSTKFREQLKYVSIWQTKRLLWNTFNFGSTNTQRDDQFKLEVGMYNPLLGKSYGELAAQSRSQHKSQGFGVPAQRGSVIEYFATIKGDKPANDLMDEVDVGWKRIGEKGMDDSIKNIIASFDLQSPAAAVKNLVGIYKAVDKLEDSYWKQQKQKEIKNVIENCSGLFLEATASSQYAVQGDSIKITAAANNRQGIPAGNVSVSFFNSSVLLDSLKKNVTISKTIPLFIKEDEKLTQPYWLENQMEKGSFNVNDQLLIGMAENNPLDAIFKINIEGNDFTFIKPIRYKFTDPVKGEIYQPVSIVPSITMQVAPAINLYNLDNLKIHQSLIESYKLFADGKILNPKIDLYSKLSNLSRGEKYEVTKPFDIDFKNFPKGNLTEINYGKYLYLKEINYDHIPAIKYFMQPKLKVLVTNIKSNGHQIGYINGAGDKVPQALEQMGYKVTMLKEVDITFNNLKQFDAIITGIRAFNTNEWIGNVHETLMQYVKEGGVLLTQYNTNNFISNVKSKIGPYDFTISRSRVTDETAKVNFLLPNHPALNYPNKITEKDFEGWIQERSIYDAEKIDSSYQRILSMKDPNENEQDGSLIIADYGKGKFVYTGLVFFRELPAGVPGAYRLFANLIEKVPPTPPAIKISKSSKKNNDSKK